MILDSWSFCLLASASKYHRCPFNTSCFSPVDLLTPCFNSGRNGRAVSHIFFFFFFLSFFLSFLLVPAHCIWTIIKINESGLWKKERKKSRGPCSWILLLMIVWREGFWKSGLKRWPISHLGGVWSRFRCICWLRQYDNVTYVTIVSQDFSSRRYIRIATLGVYISSSELP